MSGEERERGATSNASPSWGGGGEHCVTKQKRPLGRLDCRRGVYYQPILGKQTIPRLEYQVYLWGRGGRRREKRKEEIANFSLP